MGSIAVSVARGLLASELVNSTTIRIAFSLSILLLLGAAHIVGTIETDRADQHQALLIGASFPSLATFLIVLVIESLEVIS